MFETKIKEVNRLMCPVCKKGRIKRENPNEFREEILSGYGQHIGYIYPLNIPYCTHCGKSFQVGFDSINFEITVEEI